MLSLRVVSVPVDDLLLLLMIGAEGGGGMGFVESICLVVTLCDVLGTVLSGLQESEARVARVGDACLAAPAPLLLVLGMD